MGEAHPLADTSDPTRHVLGALVARHAPPEWAVLNEVVVGGQWGRRLDLVAVSHHRKRMIVVYEVKVTRADFMREMNDPEKRAAAEGVAHETWFAAPHGIIEASEIPDGWGLMLVNASGGTQRKRAARYRELPDGMPWEIAHGALRRAHPHANPPGWKPLWKALGRELDEEDLRKLAFELGRPELDRLADAEQTVERLQKRCAHKEEEMSQLLNAVQKVIGTWYGPSRAAAALLRWAAGLTQVPGDTLAAIRDNAEHILRLTSEALMPNEQPPK